MQGTKTPCLTCWNGRAGSYDCISWLEIYTNIYINKKVEFPRWERQSCRRRLVDDGSNTNDAKASFSCRNKDRHRVVSDVNVQSNLDKGWHVGIHEFSLKTSALFQTTVPISACGRGICFYVTVCGVRSRMVDALAARCLQRPGSVIHYVMHKSCWPFYFFVVCTKRRLPSAFCCLRKNKIALGAHDLFTRSRSH